MDVEGPDGKVHSFPDGTPPETIKAQMRQMYPPPAGGPQPGTAPQQGGLLAPQAQGQASMIDALPYIHAVMPDLAKGIVEHPAYKQAQKAAEMQQRAQMAQQTGLDLKSPEGQHFLLTGQLPKIEPDRVAIRKADDAREEYANSIEMAKRAKELNPQAYVGWAPELRAMVGGWMGMESAAATQEYQSIAKLLSQQIAKANSGGRVNAFEQQLMAKLQGGLDQPVATRGAILDQAIKHLQRKQDLADRQAYELRTGTYYKPPTGAPPAASKPVVERNGFKLEPAD